MDIIYSFQEKNGFNHCSVEIKLYNTIELDVAADEEELFDNNNYYFSVS